MINTIEDTKKSMNSFTDQSIAIHGWNKFHIDLDGININAYLYSNKLLDALEVI